MSNNEAFEDARSRAMRMMMANAALAQPTWTIATAAAQAEQTHGYTIREHESLYPAGVLNAAIEAAALAARDRIRAELAKLAPTETPYTRLEWRYEEKGAQRMFDKVMAVFDAPTKGAV